MKESAVPRSTAPICRVGYCLNDATGICSFRVDNLFFVVDVCRACGLTLGAAVTGRRSWALTLEPDGSGELLLDELRVSVRADRMREEAL